MRPAVLGAVGWLLLVPALYITAFDWFSPRKVRDALRGSEGLAGELDESLACDLVTDWLKTNEFARKVSCEGELVTFDDVGRLENVVVEHQHRSYCLARAPTWTVLRSAEHLPCFSTRPSDITNPIASERERVRYTEHTDLNDWMEGIRSAMASEQRPAKCPEILRAPHGVEVPLLEYELLQGSRDASWSFLTTSWLRDAIVKSDDSAAIATAHQRWSQERPWVAVITSASRDEAKSMGLGRVWMRGQLTGTLSLVDAGSGTLLCERPFSFRSSDDLERPQTNYGRRFANLAPILDMVTEERIQADFKRRYESAAMRTVNEMTSYAVRSSLY